MVTDPDPILGHPHPADIAREVPRLIVIGASAGGIEALGVLLPRLPATLRATVVVVLHLPPQGSMDLARLFAPRCRLAVREAVDKEPLAEGTLYFAPAGYHLLIENIPSGGMSLSVDEPVNFSRPSIDVLFESAAWAYTHRVLGILLTGASADGAAGLATIQAEGGETWAQDPSDARAPMMPAAAIALGAASRVLPLTQLADELARLSLRVARPNADTGMAGRSPLPDLGTKLNQDPT